MPARSALANPIRFRSCLPPHSPPYPTEAFHSFEASGRPTQPFWTLGSVSPQCASEPRGGYCYGASKGERGGGGGRVGPCPSVGCGARRWCASNARAAPGPIRPLRRWTCEDLRRRVIRAHSRWCLAIPIFPRHEARQWIDEKSGPLARSMLSPPRLPGIHFACKDPETLFCAVSDALIARLRPHLGSCIVYSR